MNRFRFRTRALVFVGALASLFVGRPSLAATCEVSSIFPKAVWSYDGPCVDGKAHGVGHASDPKVGTYDGGFEQGWFQGEGTFDHVSGKRYVGAWLRGKSHGKGTMTAPDGSKYSGDWVDGMENGMGTLLWANGTKHVGAFRNDKAHGHGVRTNPDGSVLFEGEWRDGTRFEPGKEFGLKAETTKDFCNAVIHPQVNDLKGIEWVPIADRLTQYFVGEFSKLQARWALTMGKRTEMHQALLDMERCGSQAVADLRVAEKLAIAACEQLKDAGPCLTLVGTSYRGHEEQLVEILFGQLGQCRRQTYDAVGRP